MDIESRIQAWAQSHPALRAVIVVGSRARTEHPADEWSDLDLCLFATDVQQFANSEFYRAFGEVWLSAFETALKHFRLDQPKKKYIRQYKAGRPIQLNP